ncbi:MAG: M48 family metalloprotease, partial [Mariprofundaceae bacterium]
MIRPLFALMFALLLAGCATNPVTKERDFVLMSEEQELALGQAAAKQVAQQMPLLKASDPLVRYVDAVGQRLAKVSDRPELFYRFHVVDDPTINAFALPGGYIYIHRGLLVHLNNEAELAAVLGHEIGHVTARHAVKRYTQAQAYQLGMTITSIFVPIPMAVGQISDLIALAVIQGYGREAELQSDELSLKYLARAGYDPHATIGILETLKRLDDLDAKEKREAGEKVERYHGAFASHPETEKRIREAVAKAAAVREQAGEGRGIVRHETLLRHLEGYPYGDNPEQGAVLGRRFIHPDLGIRLSFPEHWRITNTPQALTARVRKQDVYFRLQLKELVKRQRAADFLRGLFPRRHVAILGEDTRHGFDHAVARVNMS